MVALPSFAWIQASICQALPAAPPTIRAQWELVIILYVHLQGARTSPVSKISAYTKLVGFVTTDCLQG